MHLCTEHSHFNLNRYEVKCRQRCFVLRPEHIPVLMRRSKTALLMHVLGAQTITACCHNGKLLWTHKLLQQEMDLQDAAQDARMAQCLRGSRYFGFD